LNRLDFAVILTSFELTRFFFIIRSSPPPYCSPFASPDPFVLLALTVSFSSIPVSRFNSKLVLLSNSSFLISSVPPQWLVSVFISLIRAISFHLIDPCTVSSSSFTRWLSSDYSIHSYRPVSIFGYKTAPLALAALRLDNVCQQRSSTAFLDSFQFSSIFISNNKIKPWGWIEIIITGLLNHRFVLALGLLDAFPFPLPFTLPFPLLRLRIRVSKASRKSWLTFVGKEMLLMVWLPYTAFRIYTATSLCSWLKRISYLIINLFLQIMFSSWWASSYVIVSPSAW